jgi:thioesterase domain-containing protein
VYCLQAQGLKHGERALGTIEEMACHYIESVRQLRPHGPYLLAGHSLGAAVAYEMAQRLVAAGERVALLAVLDHPGPNINLTFLSWVRFHLSNLSMLRTSDKITYVRHGILWRSRVSRAGMRPAEQSQQPADGSLDVFEQALKALREYEIKPWPGRVTLFRARQGSPKVRCDASGGWGQVARGGVEIHEVPGTHMSMLDPPQVQELGAALSRCITQLDLAPEAAAVAADSPTATAPPQSS